MNNFFEVPINNASLQLLHVAAHIYLIQRKLAQKSNSSNIILMDRFWWSTYAYGLVGALEKEVIHSIIAPELLYWKMINIKKIFLLERENRERDYELEKDVAIIKNYRDLAEGDPKCRIISNNCSLEETVTKIFDSILGE
jgi:dTMP kinase